MNIHLPQGILLVNKAKGKTSFSLVSIIRKKTKIKKVGHSGTLDPFATGVMVMLIGKNYTKQSNDFINHDKEYIAEITLGKITETYDSEAPITEVSSVIPSLKEIEENLLFFNGDILQIPPMFSAKKVKGQKLYNLARKGISIEREPVKVFLQTTLLSYSYPLLKLKISCSKGTYIRSVAHDLGQNLKCGAFLSALVRTRSGPFHLKDCVDQDLLSKEDFEISSNIIC
jgi:tRNA pseudouridine55 synthase